MPSPYAKPYTPPTGEELKQREAEKTRLAAEYDAARLALPHQESAEYPAALRAFLASAIANTAKAQGAGYRAYESVMALDVVAKRHRNAVYRSADADVWASIVAGSLDGKPVVWVGYDRTPKNRFVVVSSGTIPAAANGKIAGVRLGERRTFKVGDVHYTVWTLSPGTGTLHFGAIDGGTRIGTRGAISRVSLRGVMQEYCITYTEAR